MKNILRRTSYLMILIITKSAAAAVAVSPMIMYIDNGNKIEATVENLSKTEAYSVTSELIYPNSKEQSNNKEKSFFVYPPVINNLKPGEKRIIKLRRMPVFLFKKGTELRIRTYLGDAYSEFAVGLKCKKC